MLTLYVNCEESKTLITRCKPWNNYQNKYKIISNKPLAKKTCNIEKYPVNPKKVKIDRNKVGTNRK